MGIRSAFNRVPSTRLPSSANHNGPHEGDEGDESDEGDEGCQRCHDCNAGFRFRRRNHWIEVKDVKAIVEGIVTVAADQLKKNGSFKLAGALNLKLKKKPARPARKGINPFTKEPCVFKAKPASKTVRALPKKLKEMI